MTDFHVVAANLIERKGEYLLVQEGKEAVRGEWNLPAGGVDENERIQEAARREAKEETGLEVDPESLLGVFVDESDGSNATVLVFIFHSSTGDEAPETPVDGEILDVNFFSRNEISELDVRVPFLKEAIERFESGNSMPLDAVEDFR
jgi:ADP-ribose pyrophosphatase YjhB (NUDIX family)